MPNQSTISYSCSKEEGQCSVIFPLEGIIQSKILLFKEPIPKFDRNISDC